MSASPAGTPATPTPAWDLATLRFVRDTYRYGITGERFEEWLREQIAIAQTAPTPSGSPPPVSDADIIAAFPTSITEWCVEHFSGDTYDNRRKTAIWELLRELLALRHAAVPPQPVTPSEHEHACNRGNNPHDGPCVCACGASAMDSMGEVEWSTPSPSDVTDADVPTNQCDGCRRGLLLVGGIPIKRIEPMRKGSRTDGRTGDMKPAGLWLSVGGAWPEWCKAESFALDRFKYVTRIELISGANVLWLRGEGDIITFHHEFADKDATPSYLADYIRWDRVAEQYDGIVIAPYVWSCRLDGPAHHWYYGWDCASGCIWDPRCIASFECVAIPDLSAFVPKDEEAVA